MHTNRSVAVEPLRGGTRPAAGPGDGGGPNVVNDSFMTPDSGVPARSPDLAVPVPADGAWCLAQTS